MDLGVFWYLLEAGKAYLKVAPGFTAGIAVSTLVTLRRIFRIPIRRTELSKELDQPLIEFLCI
jgi:hypothetical protein